MRELDRLPPDQRAVLSLVLAQDKSFGEVASMLGISEESVRRRAHAALDVLASVPASSASPALGVEAMPPATVGELARSDNGEGPPVAVHAAQKPPASRLGGALLLAAIVAVVAVAAVLASNGSSKSPVPRGASRGASTSTPSSTTAPSSTSTGASTGNGGVKLDKTLTLASANPAAKAAGQVYVVSQSGKHAFYVAAAGLPPSKGFFYAVWLYNGPGEAAPLGRAPTVGSDGRMEGGAPLPPNAGRYRRIAITRETDLHATRPGTIVLSGAFALR